MSDFQFAGLNLALATPFDANGKVAYGQLEENIERYLDAGISSFLLSSGTGLHVYLTREEADELIERGSKIINGRAKTIAQTSALTVDDVVSRTKHAADNGVDGVMVLPPFFEGPADDDNLFAYYEAVNAGGLPIIGYNVPGGVAPAITPDLFRRLIEIPNFVSVKDSRGDLSAEADLIRTGLPVLNGADSLAAAALYSGAAGMIWGGANIAPKAAVAFVDAAMRGEWDLARQLWRPLEPLMSHLEKGDYVPSVFAAAEMTGYPAGSPRRPFSALSAEKRALLKPFVDELLAVAV
ncbi:dihydrodipicolinate synthase family protein [Arthrobacter sp. NPDC056727]|uniref:dihydrodipicolinate synthase family protein n=1 Tax=Arthrobacter sp. NPDC056727 TaxID=3345927 RepID=UPI0036724A22